MSDQLRGRRLVIGRWVRTNPIFRYDTRLQMINVHLFFLKLFGCMLCAAKANGHDVPIDIAPFSDAIMTSHPHPEVHLQIGKCEGTVGRSNLHCWKTEHGSVLAGWLYELDSIAVSVLCAQAGRWEHRVDLWHPRSHTSSKRFQIADFRYVRRAAKSPLIRTPNRQIPYFGAWRLKRDRIGNVNADSIQDTAFVLSGRSVRKSLIYLVGAQGTRTLDPLIKSQLVY